MMPWKRIHLSLTVCACVSEWAGWRTGKAIQNIVASTPDFIFFIQSFVLIWWVSSIVFSLRSCILDLLKEQAIGAELNEWPSKRTHARNWFSHSRFFVCVFNFEMLKIAFCWFYLFIYFFSKDFSFYAFCFWWIAWIATNSMSLSSVIIYCWKRYNDLQSYAHTDKMFVFALDDQNWERKINEFRMHIETRSLLIFSIVAVVAIIIIIATITRVRTHTPSFSLFLVFNHRP